MSYFYIILNNPDFEKTPRYGDIAEDENSTITSYLSTCF